MILSIGCLLAVLDSFLAGRMTRAELEAWAERHECRDDVEYDEVDHDALITAIFRLANPAINEQLTTTMVRSLRDELQRQCRGPTLT
jgi:hypothetical protein